jgi:hypothetical protein
VSGAESSTCRTDASARTRKSAGRCRTIAPYRELEASSSAVVASWSSRTLPSISRSWALVKLTAYGSL